MVKNKTVLILGANSNLGLNIAYRLMEQEDPSFGITFILTSRTEERAIESVKCIENYNDKLENQRTSLVCQTLIVDLTDMRSILEATNKINKEYSEINYLYVNAASGVCEGINWFKAVQEIITNPVKAVTDPGYKVQKVGLTTNDGMGLIFQANVFGPYYFVKKLLDILSKGHATVVWISSIRSDPKYLPLNDLELLKSDCPYEGSKRIVDLLHLTTYKELAGKEIYQYVVQPGIFVSQSFNQYLNIITYYLMVFMFRLARMWGSYWHTIDAYKAANSPIYVSMFRDREFERQDLKYGSATYGDGVEHIKPQEMEDEGNLEVKKFISEKEEYWNNKLRNESKY